MVRILRIAGLATLVAAAPASAQVINVQPAAGWTGPSSPGDGTVVLSGATETSQPFERANWTVEQPGSVAAQDDAEATASQPEEAEPEVELAGGPASGEHGSIGVDTSGVLATVIESEPVVELNPRPWTPEPAAASASDRGSIIVLASPRQ